MPGFVPSEPDQRREAKYAERREIELRNRAAIRAGRKAFDAPPQSRAPGKRPVTAGAATLAE